MKAWMEIKTNGLLTGLRWEVYNRIFVSGPMTQGECWDSWFSTLQRHTVAPRFAELRALGVLQVIGERTCRLSGRTATVWDVTAATPRSRIVLERKTKAQEIEELRFEIEDLKMQVEQLQSQLYAKEGRDGQSSNAG